MKLAIRISLVGLHLLISTVALTAEEPQATSRPPVDFDRDVRPILSNHCFQCHGADADAREADLRLDLRSSAIEMEAIVPKDTDKSSLVTRISSTDPDERMPPADANKPLSEKQIAILKQWVAEGADYKEHWAFQRVERPATPALPDSAWCRNEIDLFILQRLNAESLRPSESADNETLIRRLYQDLLGLLPTVAETDAFLLDTPPDAYEQLVDRILSNPHYGERWGRHWLDQARYADSNGYTIDGPRVMWPYRDWVIHALNEDMPFDEFTIAQLAGDLLPEASLPQKVATGFHRNTMINEEGGVKADQFRHEAIIDRVNTTGAVWLGLTIGCAQCHSHKFDPVSHEEFYRLYAFFNACADANNLSETVAVKEGEIFGWSAEQQQKFSELQSLERELAELQKTMKSADISTASVIKAEESDPVAIQIGELRQRITKLKSELPSTTAPVKQMVMKDAAKVPDTFLLKRGDFLSPDQDRGALTPGVPQALNAASTTMFANRLDLARWLVSRDNPLTARVTVNRIWARYFGRGLVATENDFGFQSTPPSHPGLLDWLAAEFMDHGWSQKHLHRLIVNSSTYRQRSDIDPLAIAQLETIDPGNRLLSRQNRIRVEAEIVRDMAVSAAGLLSEKLGGPGIFLPQPDGIYDFTQSKKSWPTSTGPDRFRRTMYTMFYRSAPYPLLSTFDAPDFSTVCTVRVRSNTPLQSLTLANDPVFTELCEELARRILTSESLISDSDRCMQMFRSCLTRKPSQTELDLLLNFHSRELSRFESNAADVASFVKHADAGLSATQLAAWTSVARVILNTDEFVSRN